jgi:hypothetical protein
MTRFPLALLFFVVLAASARAGQPPAELPEIVEDPAAKHWVVDRFAGNSTAGPLFFQGPAREVGGLGRTVAVPVPDGRVFVPAGGGICEVAEDGMLRLVAGRPGGPQEGPAHQADARGALAWNPKDQCLYVAGTNCIRRLIEEPDGSRRIEIVCGTPGRKGFDDGPVETATFTRPAQLAIDSRGTIYVLDDLSHLRRVRDGRVTTLNAHMYRSRFKNGPLKDARFNLIGLGGGFCLAGDDTLYVADHWNFRVRKIDLKTHTVSTAVGMPKPKGKPREKRSPLERRYNRNADGPARTHASFNSGCHYVCWDPVHKRLWCGGPDERRFRRLGPDGWVRTVIGARGTRKWDRDGLGIPAAEVQLIWNAVVAVDAEGRAYLAASSDKNGLWRARNAKEVAK